MNNFAKIAVAACASILPISSASAALITQQFRVQASGFGASAPIQSVDSTFSITFDNAVKINALTTDGISAIGYPFTAPGYGYAPSGDFLTIGRGGSSNSCSVSKSGDSCFFVVNASTTLLDDEEDTNTRFFYSDGRQTYIGTRTITQIVPGTGAVPEPATWMMMILGFGVVGYSIRRKTVLRFV
jgi:hypothetical protein